MNIPAQRLADKKWGVLNHYLFHSVCNPDAPQNKGYGAIPWNDAVNKLDVERLAFNLHKMNVGYYFITLQQGTAHLLAPNETFDKIAGTKPGEACATRDIPMELSEALKKYDIDLCLYYTGDGPHFHPEIGKKMGFEGNQGDGTHVTRPFCEKWAAVLGEYAERYGDRVMAWWLDGFYAEDFGYTNELREIFYNAIKKGNPDAYVAFNDGVKQGYWREFPKEEFVCGEQNDLLIVPYSASIEGARGHILAPIGYDKNMVEWGGWSGLGLRHTKEYIRDFIRVVSGKGAVVTLDMFVDIDGSFDPEQEAALRWVGENL